MKTNKSRALFDEFCAVFRFNKTRLSVTNRPISSGYFYDFSHSRNYCHVNSTLYNN